jgi:hypothetical protein
MSITPRIFLVIFLCSLSSLAYEITLTRIFSVSLWYHFAFMVISIAMLGIGASGTVLTLCSQLRNPSLIGMYSFLLGIGISASYILSNQIPFDPVRLSWERMQLFYISLYYITLSLPFFFTGLIIATAFSSMGKKSSIVYGADLLGAGTGSIMILYAMTVTSPERAVFILSSTALIASLLISRKWLKAVSLICIFLNFTLLLFLPSFVSLRMSPYKGLQIALKYPGAEHLKTYSSSFSRIDTFRSPAVRFAPGLSLRYLGSLPEQLGFSIDGTEMNAITKFSSQDMAFVKYLPSALPYEMSNFSPPPLTLLNPALLRGELKGGKGGYRGVQGEKVVLSAPGEIDDVLILDPKGGLQVTVAKHYGSGNIYKVESNPLLIKIIRDDYEDFSGNIYRDNTWSGLGRSWLKKSNMKFDIIDISLMGSAPSGTFGISEDYKFTVEAFREYIAHLKPNGILGITLYILPPPRMELRLINTIVSAMEELGLKNVKEHVIAVRSWGSISILVKKSPLTLHEIGVLKEFSKNRRFDVIYYPGIRQEETNIYVKMPSNNYYMAFEKILSTSTRAKFINDYIFDINPVRDDYPFFNYYLKLKNVRETLKLMGGKWQYFIEEGYILPVIFIQVLLLSLVLIILPAFSPLFNSPLSKGGHRGVKNWLGGFSVIISRNEEARQSQKFLPYFAFLGLGFMFVEISLIQKCILPLENPSYAFAIVLTSILISSGIGSLLSHRVSALKSSLVLFALSILIVLYSIILPSIMDVISSFAINVKIVLIFFILLPLGLLMGIPFPTGLSILSEKNKSLVSWAWAINGCFSVLAPILTMMLAMAFGFKIVLWLGALTYILAFVTLQIFLRKSN